MRKFITVAALGLAAAALIVGPAAVLTGAADHLDGPMVQTDSRLDITDVYAFQSPNNPANSVLILNVNPLAGVTGATTFNPDGSYEFKIDTNADAHADITYRVRFQAPDSNGVQQYRLFRTTGDADSPRPDTGGQIAQGSTGQVVPVSGGGMVEAGLFDDPFFFDLAAFQNNLQFCPGGVGTNFFAGLNVTSIVLELPSSQLGTTIGVWGRTAINGAQFDRMGRPAINTVFHNHNDAGKDAFNRGVPANDRHDFRADVVNGLLALGDTKMYANGLANVLLPDILTFDTSNPAGFLNGRKLDDDVIDAELSLITNGAVTTDCVDNDSNFSSSFPYLAAPN